MLLEDLKHFKHWTLEASTFCIWALSSKRFCTLLEDCVVPQHYVFTRSCMAVALGAYDYRRCMALSCLEYQNYRPILSKSSPQVINVAE